MKPLHSLLIPLVILLNNCYGESSEDQFQCINGTKVLARNETTFTTLLGKHEAGVLLLLGFGGLSVILAVVYVLIRRYVFDDVNNLDSTFDAGGNVSASLTAVTIAAQLLWPADFMQSATVAVKYGVAGVFWYCAACVVNVSLFPLVSFKFKTRAPGAKTYLQVILARFGTTTHKIFIVFALMINLVILSSILVGGIAVLQMTVEDASPEYCILILAVLCGSYSFIGGLGSTFYVSYFNALTTFVVLGTFVINIFYLKDTAFGTFEEIYAKINCLPKVEGNRDGSYFTFLSEGALMWAVIGVILASCITYCDQASWQSRIAAKPLPGAIGFLLAAIVWFAVPATIGTVAGLTYLAVSAEDPSLRLTEQQVNSGIVSAYMSEKAMGKQGGVMMLTLLTMLTMSTGSGEIMAASSIIVYDIYQIYFRPFRKFIHQSTYCVFCGLRKRRADRYMSIMELQPSLQRKPTNPAVDPICRCPSVLTCERCKADVERQIHNSKVPGKIVRHNCQYHGDFRAYQDCLINFKNWCVLWVTLALIPFGLIIHASGIDLNWTMQVGLIFTSPCLPGVLLSLLWCRTTSKGMITGILVGLVLGVAVNLIVAYVYYEGQGGFLIATSEPLAVLGGASASISSCFALTVIISLATHTIRDSEDEKREWHKLRDIDNPLRPWAQNYVEHFPEVIDGKSRPNYMELESLSKTGRQVSVIGSLVFVVIFLVIIPGSMAGLEVLSASEFSAWVTVINIWCIVMAIVVIFVTPVEEARAIILQLRSKRKKRSKGAEDIQNETIKEEDEEEEGEEKTALTASTNLEKTV